jgi:hypothetical protein
MLRLICIAMIIGLAFGCASPTYTIDERLDPQTSATMTFSSTPMILYRDNPAYAAHAKNFVSLGPLQVNRSGHYEYFVWLGIWNTNQTPNIDERSEGFEEILLFVDGEPLALQLSGWTPAAIGASAPVYPKPVATALDAYYRVTADQLRLIANANDIQLRTTATSPRTFEPWDDQAAARESFRRLLEGVMPAM